MGNYFKELNYTLGDEDASFEMHALHVDAQHVVAVADCGSRLVPLLAKRPRKLTCVDISPLQLAMAKLRLALLEKVDLETYCAFLGYTDGMRPDTRRQLFRDLPLDTQTATALNTMMENIGWSGPVYCGKFEQMLVTLSKLIRLFTGRRAARIFECRTLEEQRLFYQNEFPHWLWKCVLVLLGNSTALNTLLYKGDFPKKNIPESYFSNYSRIFEQLFTTTLARENFFLQMIFLGHIKYREGLPVECDPDIYAKAKAAIANCRIDYIEGDIFGAMGKYNDIDFLSLSDVPSFLDDEQAKSCLQAVKFNVIPNGVVVIRGHVRLVKPDMKGYRDISDAYAEQARGESTKLWTINTYQLA